MSRSIFVNIPVVDLPRSRAFYSALGFGFNETFSDENAACLVISDTIFFMLLTEPYFSTFTSNALIDAHSHTEALFALSAESREEVDTLVNAALASGGSAIGDATEAVPGMYSWMFRDPDGHHWEIVYMEPGFAG